LPIFSDAPVRDGADRAATVGARSGALRGLRRVAHALHSTIARSETATRLYLALIGGVARRTPSKRLRAMTKWAALGQNVRWKPLEFAPLRVTLGDSVSVLLHPHLGEFDGAALFDRELDYERPVFRWLEAYAGARYDAVVEIGANVGVYSVFFDALAKRANARLAAVYSFEPSRAAFARLIANLTANDARAVTPFCVAVAQETGVTQFYEPDGHLTNGSLAPDFAHSFSTTVRQSAVIAVSGAALEPLFAPHRRVLLKIDAEGLEPEILAAMEPVLERYRPDLLVEILPEIDCRLAALRCLAPYGFLHLLTDGGPGRRERLVADPSARDWLLTASPLENRWNAL
jgi:FkbM family methyltransferase